MATRVEKQRGAPTTSAQRDNFQASNPLITDAKLKQIYSTMLHHRILSERLLWSRGQRKSIAKYAYSFGEEAAVVNAAVELRRDDWLAPPVDTAAGFLRRAPLAEIISEFLAHPASRDVSTHESKKKAPLNILPPQATIAAQLSVASGVAMAMKAAGKGNIVLVLCGVARTAGKPWQEALNFAGHHYSGHTELLADLTKSRDSVMLLVHGNMRVSHITTHTALEDVPKRVTPERISRVVALTDEALKALRVPRRRIAIAALNPHAGEDGLFGRQDIDVVEPTIQRLREQGYDVHGPVPGDTVFVKLRAEQFDAVVAMYHDQGHIPVKLLGFSVDKTTGRWEALSGVNVTLGLPIIRTSVDHGTAFDIAGRGIASETSLVEAIDLAVALARARQKVRA